jgi:hypothetical protein
VLFADRAELLACLARDARDGTAWLHWWWRDMHGSLAGDSDPVVAAWLETPEHVPAALQLLAARRQAVPFVAALPARAATTLTLRVAAAHGLAELRHAAAALTPTAPTDHPSPVDGRAPPPEPPWRKVVPESAERPLAPPVELLLGMSLVLRREPQLARTSSFATATRAWLAGAPALARAAPPLVAAAAPALRAEATPVAEATPAPEPAPDRRHAVRDRMPAPGLGRHARPTAPEQIRPPTPTPAMTETVAGAPAPPSPEATLGTPPHEHIAETTSAAPTVDAPAPVPERRSQKSRSVEPRAPRKHRRTKRARAIAATVPPLLPEPTLEPTELVVETELAGAFYLLNLALNLGLYADFSRPLEPGLALDPWDLLALLTPRLLEEPSHDDALWRLLARLAGRGPRVRPGRGFRPRRAWRTPPAWLEPFDHDGLWRWSAARNTLRLVHPAGFPTTAVPRTQASPHAQLERELRRLRPLAPNLQRTTLRPEPGQPLARWTSRLAAYSDARLRRALALGPDDSVDALLLRHRARVIVTPSHVDVTFRLADLPLEIRFAGLDRTPGWIPATGRFVAFHFT